MYDNKRKNDNRSNNDLKDSQDVGELENLDGFNNCFDKDSQGCLEANINDDDSFKDSNKLDAIKIKYQHIMEDQID